MSMCSDRHGKLARAEEELATARAFNARVEESVTWQTFQRARGRFMESSAMDLSSDAFCSWLCVLPVVFSSGPKRVRASQVISKPSTVQDDHADSTEQSLVEFPEYDEPRVIDRPAHPCTCRP